LQEFEEADNINFSEFDELKSIKDEYNFDNELRKCEK